MTEIGVWIQARFCQCQNCIHCHGGCGDPAVMALLLARNKPDFTREVAVCEHCGICLLAAHPTEFEKIEREITVRVAMDKEPPRRPRCKVCGIGLTSEDLRNGECPYCKNSLSESAPLARELVTELNDESS